MEKANFGSRIGAYIIDQLVLQAICWALMIPFMGLMGVATATESDVFAGIAALAFVALIPALLVLQFVYFGFFWSREGQSLGKKLLSIKVVSRDGELLSFVKAGLRGTFGYWLSGAVFALGFIWAAFDDDGEAWHDKIFETRVVSA